MTQEHSILDIGEYFWTVVNYKLELRGKREMKYLQGFIGWREEYFDVFIFGVS